MAGLGLAFTLLLAAVQGFLPRTLGLLPLLVGALYLPGAQDVEIGPFHFTAIRIIVLVGLVRVLVRGEGIVGGANLLDKLMAIWGAWFLASSVFHDSSVVVTRLGEIYTNLGVYYLARVFVPNLDEVQRVFSLTCFLFLPLAGVMLLEKQTGKNGFAAVFGGRIESAVRNDKVRAQGPFKHPILAGTAAAVCFPMGLCLWRKNRKAAVVGLGATVCVILASASSGPIMTLFAILSAMLLWRFRRFMRFVRWGALLLIVGLDVVMKDPVYFLIARVDLAGGSTGYYRAALMQQAFRRIGEWWLAGTDSTRHWSHVAISERHVDITNHYLSMGVQGGLPLMFIFIAVICTGFWAIGRTLQGSQEVVKDYQFLIWTLGAILFGHASTFFSVSYFDQTAVFFYMLLAVIGSVASPVLSNRGACSMLDSTVSANETRVLYG